MLSFDVQKILFPADDKDSTKGSNHVYLQMYNSFRIMEKHYLNPKTL